MPRPPKDFEDKYPDFVGLAFDFSDPPPGHDSDEYTARMIRSDLPDERRIDIFHRLLSDSDRLLVSMDTELDPFQTYLNRSFVDIWEARDWLRRMRTVWNDELVRLEKKHGV